MHWVSPKVIRYWIVFVNQKLFFVRVARDKKSSWPNFIVIIYDLQNITDFSETIPTNENSQIHNPMAALNIDKVQLGKCSRGSDYIQVDEGTKYYINTKRQNLNSSWKTKILSFDD